MSVTPVLLTYNEEENLGTTLAALDWLPRIVILDSGSTDRTQEIARSFSNVNWFERKFDNHRAQWTYAIRATSVETEYVLALDADMRPGNGFRDELQQFLRDPGFDGGWIPFQYRVLGRDLLGSIYRPQLRLFKKDLVQIDQIGHTQVFQMAGPVYHFRSGLIHDDRKPLSRFLYNQVRYAALESERIQNSTRKSLKDKLRVWGISPVVWGAYAYMRAGGPLKALSARSYAYERLIFEAILARLLAEGAATPESVASDSSHDVTRH
jgi:glycosyltransferase involved in cell wall biosynthesis